MTYSEHSSTTTTHARVVIVDDNADLRQMLALALETGGFTVVEAGNEIELQRVLAKTQPDALLIDLQRSEAQGLNLVRRMRARPGLRNVPILFLAGVDDPSLQEQATRLGADWFGLRPLGMIELQKHLVELLQRTTAAAPTAADRKRVS